MPDGWHKNPLEKRRRKKFFYFFTIEESFRFHGWIDVLALCNPSQVLHLYGKCIKLLQGGYGVSNTERS